MNQLVLIEEADSLTCQLVVSGRLTQRGKFRAVRGRVIVLMTDGPCLLLFVCNWPEDDVYEDFGADVVIGRPLSSSLEIDTDLERRGAVAVYSYIPYATVVDYSEIGLDPSSVFPSHFLLCPFANLVILLGPSLTRGFSDFLPRLPDYLNASAIPATVLRQAVINAAIFGDQRSLYDIGRADAERNGWT